MSSPRRTIVLLTASLLLAGTSAALAQSDNTSPLKGPEVTDRPATKGKGKSGFVAGKPDGKARPQPPVPMAVFTKALAAADLSAEQSAKAKSLTAEYDNAVAAFERKNKAEIDTNRAKLSEQDRQALDRMLASGRPLRAGKDGFAGGGKGKAPAKARPGDEAEPMNDRAAPKASSPEASEARAKLIEIYAQRPAAGETQAKILALLNEKQAEKVEAAIKQSAPARRGGEGKAPARGKGKGGDKAPGAGKP